MADESILVVDDQLLVRRSVGRALRARKYRTREARSAEQAWRMIHSDTVFDLVLLDLNMPRETGLEFLVRLPRPLAFPIVVLSGTADISNAVLAMKLGAADFVEKGGSFDGLLTVIGRVLGRADLVAQTQSAFAGATPSCFTAKPYRELVHDAERALISDALRQCRGNVAAAGRLLGTDRSNIFRRIKALAIAIPEEE